MKSFMLSIHRRLLPSGDTSWYPYLWLIYLGFYLFQAVYVTEGEILKLVLAASAVFLVLYFRGFWIKGPKILWIMGAITAIGCVLIPFVPASVIFLIYGGSFAGQLSSPRAGFLSLVPILLILGLWGYFLDIHPTPIIFGAVFVLLIGVLNIYSAHLNRKNVQLRLSQEEVRHLAAMTERERISRDLHDLLGHTLSVIALKSELAVKLMDRNQDRARQEIADVEQISRDALKQVREAVVGYRQTGLGGELANARLAFEASDIRFTYEEPKLNLDPEREAVLAMIVREAVTNVIRHAKANSCLVYFEFNGNLLRMNIKDDGIGGEVVEGSGLSGMRERLTEVGGSLSLETNKGYCLQVDLPLDPVRAEPQHLRPQEEMA